MNFRDYEKRELNGGIQFLYKNDNNNYGASVVQHDYSYGRNHGLWELAVIEYVDKDKNKFKLCYSTPITNDVLGYLTEDEVNETLTKISKL